METRTGRKTQEFLKQSRGTRIRLGIGLSYRTACGTGMQEENMGKGRQKENVGCAGMHAGMTSGKDREKGTGKTGRQEEQDLTDKQGRNRLDRQAGRNS